MVKIPTRLPEKSVKKGPEIKNIGKKITKYLLRFIKKLYFVRKFIYI